MIDHSLLSDRMPLSYLPVVISASSSQRREEQKAAFEKQRAAYVDVQERDDDDDSSSGRCLATVGHVEPTWPNVACSGTETASSLEAGAPLYH